jgi:predicted metal-dependent phosphoesterase TrpH
MALTDHDSVDGVDEALAAAREHGVTLVPAVEISIVDDAAPDLHVLGYGIDHRDPALADALARFRADRLGRSDRMAANLRADGWSIDDAPLAARTAEGLPIGRPHLAEAVLTHPAHAARLAAEGLETVTDLIRGYLIEGKPGFALRETPTAQEAIDVIHAAGGVAVWAHPFWDIEDADAVLATLDRLAGLGLDGVEAFYVTHDEQQTRLLADAAADRGLLSTGSADFHGPDHRLFSRFRAFELHGLEPRLGPIEAVAA